MSGTADLILDTAQDLMQTRGYSAMSFQDIAERVGIRKPSIVHHFPSKSALGEAVLRRYRETFAERLEDQGADPERDPWAVLEVYLAPFLDVARTDDKVCLFGAMSGEGVALPEAMRREIEAFFDLHQRWLENTLRVGRDRGAFRLPGTPGDAARLLFCALQGALLVKRTTGDFEQMRHVVDAIHTTLRPPAM